MPTEKKLIKIHVKFIVVTPDKLKKIEFELNKETAADGVTDSWKIVFGFSTRASASAEFGDKLIDAEIEVDTKDFPVAEETASKNLNKKQTDYLALTATPAAERFKAGRIGEPAFKRALKGIFAARNA